MLRRIAASVLLLNLLAAGAGAVQPNTPGTIWIDPIIICPGNLPPDGVIDVPIYVNAPLLATSPAVEIIAWLDASSGATFVNGPILIDTSPLGSFNTQDFDTPGVDLLTGTVLASNHASSPNRTLVPPAPPSTAGVPAIAVGVATQNGNPAPVGTWDGLLATLRIKLPPGLPFGTGFVIHLEDHPDLGSTNLGGFFDENFEFIINQPDVINGSILFSLCPEPSPLALGFSAALAAVGVIARGWRPRPRYRCIALSVTTVAVLMAAAVQAVEPNIPGTISINNGIPIDVRFLLTPGVINVPVYVNAPLLDKGPAVEIIAWFQDSGPNAPKFVNGPILIDTAPLGSFNQSDFETPGVDLITGTVLASNHASSPNRTSVPPAPPSVVGVDTIAVGVATQNGNPLPAGGWVGLLATLRIFVPNIPHSQPFHLMLSDHPGLGSTNLGGFFDENFEFVVNQPDIINTYIYRSFPEPSAIVLAAMGALGLAAAGLRRRCRG